MVIVKKVCAYITHNNRLLVFSQPKAPEAGIQVPGGSVEDGETLEEAVLREAYEETGLTGLVINGYLGEQKRLFLPDETHHRHFFHLTYPHTPPETWEHIERFRSDGNPTPIVFSLFWADIHHAPRLIGQMDAYLLVLQSIMG